MFEENVRNTCWRERYTRDDVKRKHQCLGRMLETLVGGRGILGMMLRGSTNVWGECQKHMLEEVSSRRGLLEMILRGDINVWGILHQNS